MSYEYAQWFVLQAENLDDLSELMNKCQVSVVGKIEFHLVYHALVFGFKRG